MIQTVIFDLDDTIYDFETPHKRAYEKMCREAARRLPVSAEMFSDAYLRSYDELRRRMGINYDTGAMHSRVLRIQCALEELGQPLFPHVLDLYHLYWDEIVENAVAEPGIPEVLQLLGEKGIPVGIGTNMTALVQYCKLEKLGLGQYIRFMVTSDESNCDKPDRRFFELCMQKSGTAAEHCLFVGDNYVFDYEGARNAGMHAFWYNRKNQPDHPDCPHMLKSHYELLEMIRRWP